MKLSEQIYNLYTEHQAGSLSLQDIQKAYSNAKTLEKQNAKLIEGIDKLQEDLNISNDALDELKYGYDILQAENERLESELETELARNADEGRS